MKSAKAFLLLSVGTLLLCLTAAIRAVPVQQPAAGIDLERASANGIQRSDLRMNHASLSHFAAKAAL